MLLQKSCFIWCFYDTNMSQGSAVTHLRYGGIFSDIVITNFSPDFVSERILKIGELHDSTTKVHKSA